jgi:hypothetical protein
MRLLLLPLLIVLHGCGPSGLPRTPLFAGVQGADYREGTRILQTRLEAQFPQGSSEPALAKYLAEQGMLVERGKPASATGVASFKTSGFPCGSQVRVTWVADSAHAIHSIDALYGDTGCP